jgi:GR25 family glycosyltransferase involved in LPS biosynthesis
MYKAEQSGVIAVLIAIKFMRSKMKTYCSLLLLSVFPAFVFASESYDRVLDGAMIISLGRHMHRFEVTKILMEKAGFTNIQRFEAVDGFFTDPQFFEQLNIYSGGLGQKGCAASHLLIWKKFADDTTDKEYLFVAEDDNLPHSRFSEIFPLYWEQTPKPFDIVFVGNQINSKGNSRLVVSEPTFCTHAYIISKSGARKLLTEYSKIKKTDTNTHIIEQMLINVR